MSWCFLIKNSLTRRGRILSTAVIAVRKEFLKDHPDVVEKFLRTYVELTDYINKNKEEAGAKANDEFGTLTKKPLSNDVLDKAFQRLTVTVNPETDATKAMIDMSVKTEFIKQKPDDKGLFDLTILNEILKEKSEATVK